MNDVLTAIGEDLQRAVRRRAARRRRRRLALTATLCAGGLATVTGAIAGDVDPLSLMRNDMGWWSPPAHDVRRIDLTVDGHADTWHVTLYRSKQGALCQIAVLDARRPKSVGCGAGFAIASDPGMRRAGLASIGFFGSTHGRRLIAGAVAADVERVVLTDGTGRRYPATLSSDTIAIPTVVRQDSPFASVRRPTADLPRRLLLRAYAVELPWSHGQVLGAPRMRFRLHHSDGTIRTALGPPTPG